MSLMDWVAGRLVGERPDWWPARAVMGDQPLLSDRWIIIDSESTGLSPARDRLLSVAAVTLASASLPVAEQWYATLSPAAGAAGELAQDLGDSVLIHRLTPGLIAGGMTLREAIETMCRFVGDAPVLAFHHGHAMFSESQQRVAAEAETIQVCVNPQTGRKTLMPEWFRESLSRLAT